jgi:hypothetical protein
MANYFSPSPEELAQYRQIRRNARSTYDLGQAQLNFDRSSAQGQYSDQLAKTQRGVFKSRQNLPGQFARRGLINSGIYGGAVNQFNQSAQQQYSDLYQNQQRQLGQYDVQQGSLNRNLYEGTLNANDAEAARRASIAAALRQLAGG